MISVLHYTISTWGSYIQYISSINDFVQLSTKSWFYQSTSRLRLDQDKIENNSEKNTMAETRPNLIYIYQGQENDNFLTVSILT